jgi:hypothetical protein
MNAPAFPQSNCHPGEGGDRPPKYFVLPLVFFSIPLSLIFNPHFKEKTMSEQTLGIGSRVKHPQMGKGVVVQVRSDAYEISFIEYGTRLIKKDFEGMDILEAVETPDDLVSYEDLEKSLVRVLQRFSDVQQTVPLGQKWTGGRVVLYPSDKTLKEKEIPMDTFFHKIVMIRDRIRVMEQKINASNLTDEEKVDLEQYITRIYGSLTTFNVLFKNKEDQFTGDKGAS